MKVVCVDNGGLPELTVNKVYSVLSYKCGKYLISNDRKELHGYSIILFSNILNQPKRS